MNQRRTGPYNIHVDLRWIRGPKSIRAVLVERDKIASETAFAIEHLLSLGTVRD